ncbi:branched-chain amino acid transport system ATP-binding protein [Plasticicumulans lactativorans]|uniref:Branched-chain amino acid transport system ATP-binding protein n=1 Tax=Plasticicumulans lactativorans TaxID=1133106 RepID=A0A4R2L2U3_9GAMM|nr:ATP-binding cassette domain-containing protein [Plasticicumulans lactativorans]TCO81441.1 branched-chain amino acid transport system ATP-binding protein [Plasticicumulans lactativorans]
MEALRIIRNEHVSMTRLLDLLERLRDELAADADARPDVELFESVFEYLMSFGDRLHHPKEDEYLFKALRARDPAANALIEELEHHHREGPRAMEKLSQSLQRFAELGAPARDEFLERLTRYVQLSRSHMALEERELMPLAEQRLTTIDWAEIDRAFAANDDPLFGDEVRAEFRALHTRLVHLAPAPFGLGASDVPPRPVARAEVQPVLAIRGLTSHYGRIQALRGIDLEVRAGELVALVGANGAGKTTLMRTISGLQPASGGQILFDGVDITRERADRRVVRGISQSPEGRQVFGPLSIEDNLLLGAFLHARDKVGVAADLEKVYARFPILKEKRRLPAGTLSGGQQQMLAIGRALMARPKLLLLDEPSMGLAPLLVEEIFAVVRELRGQGMTIFLVEQNAAAALSIADTGYVIETGEIVLSDAGPRLLENERVKEAYLGM